MRRRMVLFVVFALAFTGGPDASAADPPATGTGIHFLYLIRHGDYDYVADADPVAANGLNALGRMQAERLGERLAALPLAPTGLIASPYRRARETAEIIAPMLGLTIVIDTLIHECTPTTERADIMAGEAPEQVAACDSNLAAAWRTYAVPTPDADRRDLLVCHGNVIRWMVARVLGEDTQNWLRMDIANASITVIAIRPDGSMKLAAFSDTGHLAPEEQTWTGRGAGWASPKRD